MKPLPSPQLIFKSVGIHIKRFAFEKYGSVKGLAEYLEVPPSYLSQIIHGTRRPGRKIALKLIAHGFDDKLISFYDNLQLQSDYANLSKSDLIVMNERLTSMLNRSEEMLRWYEMRLNIEIKNSKAERKSTKK